MFSSRRTSTARDSSLLLPQHEDDISLSAFSPRSLISTRSTAASPSPPPSFYRSTYKDHEHHDLSNRLPARPFPTSPSSSPSIYKHEQRCNPQLPAPPPPIATSVLLNPRRAASNHASPHMSSRRRGVVDPLLLLQRRERVIQQELQTFLDAQSIGLIQGFGGEVGNGASSEASDAGSSTPTVRSERSRSGVTPVRQPRKRIVGLRSARRGLGRDMGELVQVKREEGLVLGGEIERREDVLERARAWKEQIKEVKGLLGDEEGGKGEQDGIAGLQDEERAIKSDIRDMEERLVQMKARQNWIGERIRESTNRREARLSSYKGALKEVESEVKDFLKRPPVEPSSVMGDEEGFTTLPESRRTLGMASEWWTKEIKILQQRKTDVAEEKQALEDGEKMWENCVSIVTELEDDLRAQMQSNAVQEPGILQKQVEKMDEVVSSLEEKHENAKANGWNLLVCAIGAELAAFREGKELLRVTLNMLDSQHIESSVIELKREESFCTAEDGVGSLGDLTLESPNGQERQTSSVEDSEDHGLDLAHLYVDKRSQEFR